MNEKKTKTKNATFVLYMNALRSSCIASVLRVFVLMLFVCVCGGGGGRRGGGGGFESSIGR